MTLNDMIPMADLWAQLSMADSARIMLKLTWTQIIIGFFGTFALIGTILQAQRSQRLAEKALNQQHEMSKRELRAYLTVKVVKLWVEGNTAKIKIGVTNGGATPAFMTIAASGATIRKPDMNSGIDVGYTHANFVIPAGATEFFDDKASHEGTSGTLGFRLTLGPVDGALAVALIFEAHYYDVFNDKHVTCYGSEMSLRATGEHDYLRFLANNSAWDNKAHTPPPNAAT